jgi:hypothetical protein
MRRALPLLIALTAVTAGCGLAGDVRPLADPPELRPFDAQPGGVSDRAIIRGWLDHLNKGRFEAAAGYFAPGAVIELGSEFTLRSQRHAVEFNRALPCRAVLTDTRADGDATIAAFRLAEGLRRACKDGGSARVRFVVRDRLIAELRLLRDAAAASRGQ